MPFGRRVKYSKEASVLVPSRPLRFNYSPVGGNYTAPTTPNPAYRPFVGYQSSGRSMSGYTQSAPAPGPGPYRRPAPYVRFSRRKGKKAPLGRRVRVLEKQARDELSVITYKTNTSDYSRPSAFQALYGWQNAISIAQIEAAAANGRFFDPAAPGTLVTASLVTGTYQSKFRVQVRSTITIRNNYQVPAVVHCGLVAPKVATSTDPNTAVTNGWVDQGNPTNTSTMLTWGDSKQFRETYRFLRKPKKYNLPAGGEIIKVLKQKSFVYDPSYFDTNTATYQPAARSKIWVFRCMGVVGHDSAVTTEVTRLPAGIDIFVVNTYTIFYNSGGATVDTIVLNNGASTIFTNAGVVSQVVRDNQSYSLS